MSTHFPDLKNPELMVRLASGPRYNKEEAEFVLHVCSKLTSRIPEPPSKLEENKLQELTLSQTHALYILHPVKDCSSSRYRQETERAYANFFEKYVRKPVEVCKVADEVFSSLDRDYVSREEAQKPKIRKRHKNLTELNKARMHAHFLLGEEANLMLGLAKSCEESYHNFGQIAKEAIEHNTYDAPRSASSESSPSESSPSSVASIFRKVFKEK